MGSCDTTPDTVQAFTEDLKQALADHAEVAGGRRV